MQAQILIASLVVAALLRSTYAQPAAAKGNSSILEQRYEAAQRYQSANDLPKAAEQYRIFVADALGEAAMGRARAGQYDKAQDDFDEALTLVPDFPMLQLEYARVALRSGRLEHAEVLARALIEHYPNDARVQPGAHTVLGRVLLKLNKDSEATVEFERAVALNPTFENGYELAVADLDLGDEAGASKIFAEMLTSFGDSAEIHLYFGQAFGNSDAQSRAIEEFRLAIERNDRLPGVHYALASVLLATSGGSKVAEAEAELRKEIAISPTSPSAYAALGHLLVSEEQGGSEQSAAGAGGAPETGARESEGEADLKRATVLDPESPDAFLYLGEFYSAHDNPVSAAPALRKAIALTTDVSRDGFQVRQAHYLLGRILMQQGQQAEGKSEIALSSELQKQNLKRDQNRLSDYLREKPAAGQADEPTPLLSEDRPADPGAAAQVDAFERQMTPAIADSYNNLGAIAGTLGEHHAALVYFRGAAEWQDAGAPAAEGLDLNWGRAAFEDGAYAEAIAPLSRYLAAHPGTGAEEMRARTLLGLGQYLLKDYANARRTLEPVAAAGGSESASVRAQCAYADSLVHTGDAHEGLARLNALAQMNPGDAEIQRVLGEAVGTKRR